MPRRRVLPASVGFTSHSPLLLVSILIRGADAVLSESQALPHALPYGGWLSAMQLSAEPLPAQLPLQLPLSPLSVAFAAALMLVCGAISMQLSLGLHKTIALATLRQV